MNKSLGKLPKNKKEEIKEIVRLIVEEVPETLMVILFGSYATGKYVEYDQRTEFGVRTMYISDYDFMVITPQNNKKSHESIMHRLSNARNKFYVDRFVMERTPVSFFNETLDNFNKKILKGRYFYTDIKKQGVLLFNANPEKYKLARIKKLNFTEIRDLAVEYFEEKTEMANSFLRSANHDLNDGDYKMSSFHLHQATENYLSAIILTSSLYKPKKHDLIEIIDETKLFTTVVVNIFPEYNKKTDRLFQLLYDAYIQARYNKKFVVTKNDIDELLEKITVLKEKTKEVCEEKIREYNNNISKRK